MMVWNWYRIRIMTDNIVEIVSDEFIKHKIIGACLCASIILVEKLKLANINSEVVEGYISSNNRYYGRHYWVRINNEKDADIGTYILGKTTSKKIDDILLSRNEPKHLERADMDTLDGKETLILLEQGYNIYKKYGIKQFFKQSPKKIKQIKEFLLK